MDIEDSASGLSMFEMAKLLGGPSIKETAEIECGCQRIAYKDGFEVWWVCPHHALNPSEVPAHGAVLDKP